MVCAHYDVILNANCLHTHIYGCLVPEQPEFFHSLNNVVWPPSLDWAGA